MKLIANKPLTYATRRLLAGDTFEASSRDARLLVGIKKARPHPDRVPGSIEPPPTEVGAKIAAQQPSELAQLRATYKAKTGKNAAPSWKVEDLKAKLAEG